jgi:hypothetical protein
MKTTEPSLNERGLFILTVNKIYPSSVLRGVWISMKGLLIRLDLRL